VRAKTVIDIYGKKDPGDVPIYSVSEAAHYLRLPTATARSWALGRRYPIRSGEAGFRPLIDIADSKGVLLSFINLAELHILSSIRRIHQVRMVAVRNAIDYLRKELESNHPLLHPQMFTDGKQLFIERYGNLVSVSQRGQMAMSEVMDAYLERIRWDRKGTPFRLFPFTRPRYTDSPKLIFIDPRIRFGKPCITGTRIPTAIILERYQAGDSIDSLAKDYGRNGAEIEEAIRYESRIAS
jgi:uncharacterized protein (DUF433 family)